MFRRRRRANPQYEHERLADPKQFDSRSFRTIHAPHGHRLVVGCPTGEWSDGACRVGTMAQALLHPARHENPGECPAVVDVSMVAVRDESGRLHPVPPAEASTNPSRRKYLVNLEGYVDDEGRFHPIRASADYDPRLVGEAPRGRRPRSKRTRRPKRSRRT